MKRWVALLSVAALFVVGVAVGVLGANVFLGPTIAGPPEPGMGRGPGGGPHREGRGPFHVERLKRHLDLTAEQEDEIRRIVDASREEADALMREVRPQLHEQMDRTRTEIRGVLTPEQLESFDQLRERHRRRGDRFLLGRGR
ncbi:MAG: hypothetical protein GY716_24635 [bacterium]|nr:hypothetical protein [bacterium]